MRCWPWRLFASAANLRVCDPLLPQIADQLGVTVGAAAGMVTAFAIAYGVSQLAVGPIGDARGKLPMVVLGSVLTGLATMLCAAMPTLGSLMVARFVAGACAAAVIPLAMAWIGDVIPYERRQPILARFLSGQILGVVFGQAAGGLLGDWIGWRGAMLLLGACTSLPACCCSSTCAAGRTCASRSRPHALGRCAGFRHRDGGAAPGCASCSSPCSSKAW